MKLYIKQKVFSIGDSYNIYDEGQNPVFQVKQKLLALLPEFHIYAADGTELYTIKRKIALFAKYEIYRNSGTSTELVSEINQKFNPLNPTLHANGSMGNYEISGDLFGFSFDIKRDGAFCGSVSKVILSWGDSYELNFADNEDTTFMATLVVAIDNCLHSNDRH